MPMYFRVLNVSLQIIVAILEITALHYAIELLSSHCIKAGEYGISVWPYLFVLPGITLQSVVLTLLRICCWNVGLDPIAIVFNLISGILCIITSTVLLIAMMKHCQNEFQYMFYVTASCGHVAGFLHLFNAYLCNFYMPKEEIYHLKPSKWQRRNFV